MDKPTEIQDVKDVRCVCGRLTARLEKRGVVIKCHRCGAFVVISRADLPADCYRQPEKGLPG